MSDDTKRKIEVMQAYLDGEEIEFATAGDDDWEATRDFIMTWDWSRLDYRIKPKPRECWMLRYDEFSTGPVFWSRDKAARYRGEVGDPELVHVREVMDGEL